MFSNRVQAGQLMAVKLQRELVDAAPEDLLILSIPRGGVVVAKEIAKKLKCLHDVIVTKKLRAPNHEELAIGAVGETEGSLYLNKRLARDVGADDRYISQEIKDRREEIKRREKIYRGNKRELSLADKTVIIVDDGAATGATIIAAAREVWNNNPHKLIIGLPVCARDTLAKLEKEADMVIALETPEMFYAVGQFYQEFPQIEDEQVVRILNRN